MRKIRTFIVDDSVFFRVFLEKELSKYPNIEIIGRAMNASDAKKQIPVLKPDVVTLDVEMPGMSGIDFLGQLIPTTPVPVVLVSALNIRVFDALSAGAVDFVKKPDAQSPESVSKFLDELASKVVIASAAKVTAPAQGGPAGRTSVARPTDSLPSPTLNVLGANPPIIALGASTGGTEATLTVLKQLPAHTPGILIVQHMPPGFTKMYADRLNKLCAMEVREARNGDQVRPGLALIAPGDQHMQLAPSGSGFIVRCAAGEKVSGHCPSVDVLFRSVAKIAKGNSVGIIMTGMGRDGADGLLSMRKAGAFTIGQDEASCVVYGMPMVAFNIGAVAKQAACDRIPAALTTHLNSRQR